VLLVAVGLSTLTTLLAGLAPALWAARPNLVDVLRTGGRTADVSPRAELFRRALVVGQVAIALVTLACGALAAKSFVAAKRTDPGFDASGVLLGSLRLDTSGYTRDQALALLERLEPELAALPGVDGAALAENIPLGLDGGSWEMITVPGYVPAPNEDLRTYRNLISPGYFSLLRIPLREGRDFNAADRRGAPLVAIVNETFARRYFAGASAVGRTFALGGRSLTIVGVVRDTRIHQLNEPATPYYYVPLQQAFVTDTGLGVHLRVTSGDPLALLPALRAAVHRLDPRVSVFESTTLADSISAARFVQKAAASLLAVLSVIALALVSLGLYGVLAFTVAQRTTEIGVRLALGARPADIARLVLVRGMALLACGLGLGLLAAAAVARGLAATFYGISAFEPLLLAAAIVPVAATALLACWLPARRAARVDPMTALRAE
jgi:predicted permease